MSIEAMKLALAFVEGELMLPERETELSWSKEYKAQMQNLIVKLRAAIEQAEKQEPVAWITTWNEPNDKGVELHWAKQNRGASSKHTPLFYNQHKPENCEPYAWAYKTNNTWEHISFVEPPDDAYDEGSLVVLYTTPPKILCGCGDQIMPDDGAECGTCVTASNAVRDWVGLTDEDIYSIIESNIPLRPTSLFEMVEWVAKVVEAKLKEKNGA